MNKLKRSLAFLLSIFMLFPTIAQATETINGTSGNGFHGSYTGAKDSEYANWNSNQVGVRVSIVDKDGNTVLKGNSGNYTSVDIIFSEVSYDDTWFRMTGNKFQNYKEGGIYTLPVGSFNTKMIESIIKSKLLESKREEMLANLTPYADAFPQNYVGLPAPILWDSSAQAVKPNGLATKQFFVRGDIGSISLSGTAYTIKQKIKSL